MIWCRINGRKYRCEFQEKEINKVVLINEETKSRFFIPKDIKISELPDIMEHMEKY
jgi:hypothetical protein